MNALGALLTLLFAIAVVALPRRRAVLAVFAAICYITQGQYIVVGALHFTAIRIVLLAGILRALVRGEIRTLTFNRIDKALGLFLLVSSLLFMIRTGNVVYETGQIYNVLFGYLTFRCLLPSFDDVVEFLPGLAFIIVPMACFQFLEFASGANFFGAFGGVTGLFRDGHFRASSAFRSPITAGTLGASFLPLFIGLYWTSKHRFKAVVGIMAATVITAASLSSGPAIEYLAALGGLLFWRWRQHTQLARRGFVVALIVLHMIMKAPVWFLMAHVSDLIGGGGWHRAAIIDAAVKHFSGWWLCGTSDTGDWMATQILDGGADLTNQFVAAAITAGLPGMLLFIWIIVRCFKNLALSMKKSHESWPDAEKMLWAIGATLFATVVNFFSVSYFDQIENIWYFLVAIIASSTSDILRRPDETAEQHATDEVSEDFATQSSYRNALT